MIINKSESVKAGGLIGPRYRVQDNAGPTYANSFGPYKLGPIEIGEYPVAYISGTYLYVYDLNSDTQLASLNIGGTATPYLGGTPPILMESTGDMYIPVYYISSGTIYFNIYFYDKSGGTLALEESYHSMSQGTTYGTTVQMYLTPSSDWATIYANTAVTIKRNESVLDPEYDTFLIFGKITIGGSSSEWDSSDSTVDGFISCAYPYETSSYVYFPIIKGYGSTGTTIFRMTIATWAAPATEDSDTRQGVSNTSIYYATDSGCFWGEGVRTSAGVSEFHDTINTEDWSVSGLYYTLPMEEIDPDGTLPHVVTWYNGTVYSLSASSTETEEVSGDTTLMDSIPAPPYWLPFDNYSQHMTSNSYSRVYGGENIT